MKTIREVFSSNLKSLRGARTQAQIAESAQMPLVSYQRCEGGSIPQGPNLAAIAKALGVPETRLFLDEELLGKPDPLAALEVVREALLAAHAPYPPAEPTPEQLDALDRQLEGLTPAGARQSRKPGGTGKT